MRDLRLSISVPLKLAVIFVVGFALVVQPSANAAMGAVSPLAKVSGRSCDFRIDRLSGSFLGLPPWASWSVDVTNTSDAEVTIIGEVVVTAKRGSCATHTIPPTILTPHSTQTISGYIENCSASRATMEVTLRNIQLTCEVSEQIRLECPTPQFC